MPCIKQNLKNNNPGIIYLFPSKHFKLLVNAETLIIYIFNLAKNHLPFFKVKPNTVCKRKHGKQQYYIKKKHTRTIPLCGHGTVSDKMLMLFTDCIHSALIGGNGLNRWPSFAHEQHSSSNNSY